MLKVWLKTLVVTTAALIISLSASAVFAKSAVVYYSLSGNTDQVAKVLAEMTGADLYRIETEKSYPSDFDRVVEQAREERRTNYLPPLKPMAIDWSQYDTVFLGFPVWSSSIAQPVKTFLTQNSLKGKNVYPFCTHDGYGAGQSRSAIQSYSPDANVHEVFDMLGSQARNARSLLKTWLDGIGLTTSRSIVIEMDGRTIPAQLNDSYEAEVFYSMLPVTVNMHEFDSREFYGPLDGEIKAKAQGQLRFNDGDITYCPFNNTVAIFYSQSERPNLTMHVIPMGKVLVDPKIFHEMDKYQKVVFRRN